MAADAVFVQNGLNFFLESNRTFRTVKLDDSVWSAARRHIELRRGNRVLIFVASRTGNPFARHAGQPGTHDLQSVAVFVQRLQSQRDVGRNNEVGAAVRLDVDFAQEDFAVPGRFFAHSVVVADAAVSVLIAENAELFDRPDRNVFQTGAKVDVCNIADGFFVFVNRSVSNHRRAGSFLNRKRFEDSKLRRLFNQNHVVERIDQIQAPSILRRGLSGNEEIIFIQRAGEEELRPGAVNELVFNNRLDFLVAERDLLNDAFRFFAAAFRVDDMQFAHSGDAVVPGYNGRKHFGVLSRNRLGIEHAVGPVRTGTVEFNLVCSVRIHVHHDSGEVVVDVDVFPAQIHDSTVVHQGRVPVLILFVGQLTAGFEVFFNAEDVADVPGAADARYAHHGRAGYKQIRTVRNEAAFDVVNVFAHERRNLLEFRLFALESLFQVDFVNFPRVVFGLRCNENLFGVPFHADVADKRIVRGVDNRFNGSVLIVNGNDGQLVAVIAFSTRAVGHPVSHQPRVFRRSNENLVKVEKRVCQQGFAAERQKILRGFERFVYRRLIGRVKRREYLFVFIQFSQIFFTSIFIFVVFFRQIFNRHAKRTDLFNGAVQIGRNASHNAFQTLLRHASSQTIKFLFRHRRAEVFRIAENLNFQQRRPGIGGVFRLGGIADFAGVRTPHADFHPVRFSEEFAFFSFEEVG